MYRMIGSIYIIFSILSYSKGYKEQYKEIKGYIKQNTLKSSSEAYEREFNKNKNKIKSNNIINIDENKLTNKYFDLKDKYTNNENRDLRKTLNNSNNNLSDTMLNEIKFNISVIDKNIEEEINSKNLKYISDLNNKNIKEGWSSNKYIDDIKSKYSKESIKNELDEKNNRYEEKYKENYDMKIKNYEKSKKNYDKKIEKIKKENALKNEENTMMIMIEREKMIKSSNEKMKGENEEIHFTGENTENFVNGYINKEIVDTQELRQKDDNEREIFIEEKLGGAHVRDENRFKAGLKIGKMGLEEVGSSMTDGMRNAYMNGLNDIEKKSKEEEGKKW